MNRVNFKIIEIELNFEAIPNIEIDKSSRLLKLEPKLDLTINLYILLFFLRIAFALKRQSILIKKIFRFRFKLLLQDLNSSLQLQRRLILLLKLLFFFYKFQAFLNDNVVLFRDVRLDNIDRLVNNNIVVVARDYEHYNNNNI